MFDIYLGKQSIGKATVTRQGMYGCIVCKCHISGQVPYRVELKAGEKFQDLGLLVPENGWFTLTKRVPIRFLEGAELKFDALPARGELNGKFVPISAEEPFRYLSRLENAYLARRGKLQGIVISNPTGQWSEP